MSKKKTQTQKYIDKLCTTFKENVKNFWQNLTFKKICIYLMIASILVIIGYTFFEFSLLVTPDGSAYYRYLDFFQGELGFENWRIIRGFGFPLILFVITSLFGESPTGLLIGFFGIYLLMLILGIKIIRLLIRTLNKN